MPVSHRAPSKCLKTITRVRLFYGALFGILLQSPVQAMGLRSFVALPVEKGGQVLRASVEHNDDTDTTYSALNLAYGVSHTQTLLLGVPYRLSSGEGDRLGDVSALYRHIVLQADTASGTDRFGLLGGVMVPTDSDRDGAVQAGGVFTHFRGRYELDLDVLYQQGLDDRENSARYDISWQYRLSPTEYPEWGLPVEWYLVTELGGRWRQGSGTTHQFTLGVQRVASRWVFEGGIIADLNHPDHTRFLFSIRYH